MKIEKREVVVTKEVFIAVDGKEFDNRDACSEHEFILNEARIPFYDHNFKKSDLDSCTYARLDTEDDVKLMIRLCKHVDITVKGLINPGIYVYTGYQKDMWLNMTECINRICGGGDDAKN